MRELFPGFYDKTEEELFSLWKEAAFVFDANMLLNVYRYQEETRNRFFEILEQLKPRIWVPYQAVYEYQKNRLKVIDQQQLDIYNNVSSEIKKAQRVLEGLKHLREKHRFIDIQEIINAPIKALGEANNKLSVNRDANKQEFEALKGSDIYRERISQLFQGKIGEPYKKNRLFDLYQQAEKRFELQIPPGYKDKRNGDVILWFQLLDYASKRKNPIIFVTDDVKPDWFISARDGGYAQPRQELVQEMFVEANILFHIYQGYEFFDQSTKFLNLLQVSSISEDAREVSLQNAIESESAKQHPLMDYERAVWDWLLEEMYYTDKYKTKISFTEFSDFFIVETDEKRIGVTIERKSHIVSLQDAAHTFGYFIRRGEKYSLSDSMIALVCEDSNDANNIYGIIKTEFMYLSKSTLFVIGYIASNGKFFVSSRIN